MTPLKVLDVFSGVGGLSAGFTAIQSSSGQKAFDVGLLVDKSGSAINTFRRNYPRVRSLIADVSTINASRLELLGVLAARDNLDVLVGGPPCQGFSILRKNKHLDDDRNLCVREFLRLVDELQPKVVLMENVKNLYYCNEGTFKEEILELLDDYGYDVDLQILNASHFGVPQMRERVFMFAFRRDLGIRSYKFKACASVHEKVNVYDAIDDLPALNPGESRYIYGSVPSSRYQSERRGDCEILHNHEARAHSAAFVKKLSGLAPGDSNRSLDPEARFDKGRDQEYFSQAYGRLHPDMPAYTITTHFHNPGSGRFLHYRDLRSITVREAARLQGFDDKFIFCGSLSEQQEQVGNAVPPLLSRVLAHHIAQALGAEVQRKKIPGKPEAKLNDELTVFRTWRDRARETIA